MELSPSSSAVQEAQHLSRAHMTSETCHSVLTWQDGVAVNRATTCSTHNKQLVVLSDRRRPSHPRAAAGMRLTRGLRKARLHMRRVARRGPKGCKV